MSLWDSLFTHLRQPIAQILLTRNDIADVGSSSARHSFNQQTNKLYPSEQDILMLKTPSTPSLNKG